MNPIIQNPCEFGKLNYSKIYVELLLKSMVSG